jgi:hypothetical protein
MGDMEDLIKATAAPTGENLAEVRSRAQQAGGVEPAPHAVSWSATSSSRLTIRLCHL